MDEIKDVRELIRLKWETLTPIQKRIANYILENFEEISIFLNAKSLAEDLNVSRAAITRFANALGFSGVLALNKNLKEFAKVWMTPSQRFSKRRNSTDKEDSLWVTFDQDIRNLERTLKNIDRSVFLKVADAISKANTIYIIGLGDAASLSWLLSFQLSLIFDDVRSITRADMV
ncbi:MAG: MurR/RpiR family transcriptional regulator, partial [Firmicutes bacterium]|nr:MurR/RpiR family transcriptional regulator [Bacillota bacterium]